VPIGTPVRVLWPPVAPPISLAMPKSSSLGISGDSSSATRNTFSGFRSRWTIPAAWAASSARAIPRKIGTASSAGMRPRWRTQSSSVTPVISSITKYCRPSGSEPKPKMSTMFLLRIWLTARASATKRDTISGSPESYATGS
jgi:hypothetical protein